MESVISINNIFKKYYLPSEEIDVLDGISLNIEENKTYFIKGVSGSGKSTLLKIIGGIDLEYKGSVVIENKNLKVLDPWQLSSLRQKKIGFVFQDFHLLGHLTAFENVVLPGLFSDRKFRNVEERAYWLLKRLGLENFADHHVHYLSRGEKQRVAFARALINSPTILLADEPTASLDEKNQENLFSLLDEIKKEVPFTLIAVMHNIFFKPDFTLLLSEGKMKVLE